MDRLLYYYGTNFIFSFLSSLVQFIAALIVALVLVIIGYFIAKALSFIVSWLIEKLKFNKFLKNVGFDKILERANVALQAEQFLGNLTFWVIWILFWMPALEVLGLSRFNDFITQIVNYLPTAIVGGLIIVAAYFLAEFMRKVSYTWFKGIGLNGSKLASEIVFYSLLMFGFVIALSHLGVARDIMNLITGGFVLALALALGLSFGLGGQEIAREALDKIKNKILE